MPVFFLSYRRADQDGRTLAHMLYRELTSRYGPRAAFFDVDQRRPGIPFPAKVQQALTQSDVMLVIMGGQWLEILRQRAEDERDWVRHEVASGLARGDSYPVVPVLCPGVAMPSASQLPEELKELQWRDGVTIDPFENFRPHLDKALQDIETVLADLRGEQAAREAAARPSKDRPFVNSLGMKFVPVPGAANLLMSIWETRVQDYAAYAAANPAVDGSWRNVEFKGHKQGPDHPVVNVSWEDAQGFCAWLSKKEGKTYRVPTDHEWSLAVGVGDREDPRAIPQSKSGQVAGVFPWGMQWPPPPGAGNYYGEEAAGMGLFGSPIQGYRDAHPFTAPVGSYTANPLGIFDLGGNVWEWCEDFYDGKSGSRVLRGASWGDYDSAFLLSSGRYFYTATGRGNIGGFRVVFGGVR